MSNKRGSVWSRWDLHFHTPSSYDYLDFSVTNDEIINGLIANDIKLVAITDHHIIDVERINELKQISKGRITILPGIELRSELGGSESVHFIGIFPEDIKIEKVWQEIQVKCKIDIDQIKKQGNDASIYCDFKETSLLIRELGGIVTVHSGKKSNSIERITNSLPHAMAMKKELVLDYINILELGKEADQEDYKEIVFPAIGNILPTVICSDNHNIKDYIIKQNCWYKAEPTFNGLKQILFEPEGRVRIQKENPEITFPKLRIESISISNCNKFPIANQKISFNRDLVCIIGGRGSGKSAILETLTHCFGKSKSQTLIESDEESVESFINYYKRNGCDLNIEICYANLDNKILEPYNLSIQSQGERCSYPILYLGQNQIEAFSSDKNKIHELAFDAVIKSSSFSDEFASIEAEINGYETELLALNKEIEASRIQLSAYNIEKLNIEKQRIIKELELLSSDSTRDILGVLQEKRNKRDLLLQSFELNEKLNKEIVSFENRTTSIINQINNINIGLGIQGLNLFLDLSILKSELTDINEHLKSSEILVQYDEAVKEAELQLQGLTDVSVQYIESLKSRLDEINKEFKIHEAETSFLNNNINYRYDHLVDIANSYKDYFELYEEAIKEFSDNNSATLKSLKLEATLFFDINKLKHDLFEQIDKRKIKTVDRFSSEYLRLNLNESLSHVEWIKNFEAQKENFDNFYDDGRKKFEEIAYKNYINLNTKIFYEVEPSNLKTLSSLSLGQKGTVLLKLFLNMGNNCPIIIDQPEDHLDNDFIYSDLVSTIRNAKMKRQIVIVTHDANLVINGDAEQVIVARFENDIIDHQTSGALESPDIRKKAAKILEGGDEAFRKREQKYQFQESI
jgi:DNA repair protein SbcC/Rad50